jgi:hypothetical protein
VDRDEAIDDLLDLIAGWLVDDYIASTKWIEKPENLDDDEQLQRTHL